VGLIGQATISGLRFTNIWNVGTFRELEQSIVAYAVLTIMSFHGEFSSKEQGHDKVMPFCTENNDFLQSRLAPQEQHPPSYKDGGF
jgi:hypothetical protein